MNQDEAVERFIEEMKKLIDQGFEVLKAKLVEEHKPCEVSRLIGLEEF